MADSLADLGPNTTLMDFDANWQTDPTEKREILINSNIYPGTIHSIDFYSEPRRKPTFQIQDLETKLYSFLVFFADRVARKKSFWLPDKFNRFTAVSIAVDLLSIEVEKLSDLHLHGHERLFIRLINGDRISRKISSIQQLTSTTKINLASLLPSFALTDIELISFLLYVRLDQDEIEITYHTDCAASVDLAFVELLEEYDLWP